MLYKGKLLAANADISSDVANLLSSTLSDDPASFDCSNTSQGEYKISTALRINYLRVQEVNSALNYMPGRNAFGLDLLHMYLLKGYADIKINRKNSKWIPEVPTFQAICSLFTLHVIWLFNFRANFEHRRKIYSVIHVFKTTNSCV